MAHVCCLACALLCCVRLSVTAAEDSLTASTSSSNVIKLSCNDGQQLDLRGVEWSPFASVDADFERKCDIQKTKRLFHKLCEEKERCNLPINFSSECLDRARLSIHYFCRTQPTQPSQPIFVKAREPKCPPCPPKVQSIDKVDIALIVVVALLFVTNVVQISCFVHIAKKHRPKTAQSPAPTDGLRLSRATTARRLPPHYADKLTSVPVHHFTSGVIAKKVEGAKQKRRAMGAKPQTTQHRFSLLIATADTPTVSAASVSMPEHLAALSSISELNK